MMMPIMMMPVTQLDGTSLLAAAIISDPNTLGGQPVEILPSTTASMTSTATATSSATGTSILPSMRVVTSVFG